MKKTVFTTIGFLLFILGTLALVLSFIGAQISFLRFIDAPGQLFGFIVRLVMIFVGVIMIVLSRSDFEGEGYV
ncbi:MAG: hypothetical protein AAGK47_06905 [Bacteroidota bacterium]